MLCKFEEAINYIILQSKTQQSDVLIVEGVHIGIVLYYYGVLLTTTKTRTVEDSYLVKNTETKRYDLALLEIIKNYTLCINAVKPLISSLYFYVILSNDRPNLGRELIVLILLIYYRN